MANTIRLAFDLAKEHVAESINDGGRYQAEVIPFENEEAVHEARTLSTATLLRHGKIDPATVENAGGIDGYLAQDAYHLNSIYFGCYDTEGEPKEHGRALVVATRLILAGDSVDNIRLPIRNFAPGHILDALDDHPPGTVAEFGALAKAPHTSNVAAIKLFREVLGTADEKGLTTLVAGMEPKLWEKSYRILFGGALSRMVGIDVPARSISGPQTPLWLHVPTFLENQKAHSATLRKRQRLAAWAVRSYVAADSRLANRSDERRAA